VKGEGEDGGAAEKKRRRVKRESHLTVISKSRRLWFKTRLRFLIKCRPKSEFINLAQNLKFVALGLPVPEITGYSKNGQSLDTPTLPIFSQIFNGLLFGWTL